MPGTGRLRLTWPRLVLLGPAAIIVASVARFSPPNYALEPLYTDHLQHEYSAWAFLHIGLRIFDTRKATGATSTPPTFTCSGSSCRASTRPD